MMFAERLHQAQIASNGLLCVGLDPDLDKLPADLRARSEAAARLQSAHHRCDTGHRRRLQAANRLLQRARQRGRARRQHPLHARARARRAGDPRCEAQRHRQYRAGLRDARRSSATAPTPSRSIPTWARTRCCPFSRGPTAGRSCCAAPRIPGPGIFRICSSTGCPCTGSSPSAPRRSGTSIRNLMLVVGATYPAGNGRTAPRAPCTMVLGSRDRGAGRRPRQHTGRGLEVRTATAC